MSAHPNMIFDAFNKVAAASATGALSASGPAGMGDSMKSFKSETRTKSTWSAPNPSQAVPMNNPIAAQKIAPPPPVQ